MAPVEDTEAVEGHAPGDLGHNETHRRANIKGAMSKRADVLIWGRGVIGLTTAYYLAGRGVNVEVIDQYDMGRGASWAGAGIIAPGRFAGASTPLDQLRALSAEMFPDLSADLRDRT